MDTIKKIVTFVLCLWLPLQVYSETVKSLQDQQKQLQAELKQTNKLLQQTKSSETATTQKLTLLNRDIKTRKKLIANINSEIGLLDNDIQDLNVKKQDLQQQLDSLKRDYEQLVCHTHFAYMQAQPLLFLFSANSFHQLLRRIRYMQEFVAYRKRQMEQITQTQTEIDVQNQLLANRKTERATALKAQQREKEQLDRDQRKQQKMLTELKKKEKDLLAKQKKQQAKVNQINQKIDELIRKQTRTTQTLTKEQQLLSGGFEANKGRLPWPVAKGFISGYFGEQQHPIYKQVIVNNKGIYIQTEKGASARAVFDGDVTSCIVLGNSYAVIVQHGSYRTVYSNLKTLAVKQGDHLKAKQNIGTILSDAEEDNKTELYFQIYKDRTILNPSLWLSK